MKIAMIMFPLGGLGGIVSNIENLCWGLKEIGHDVNLFLFSWQNKFMTPKYSDDDLIGKNGWYRGFTCATHQSNGWNLPLDRKVAYKGNKNLRQAKRLLKKFDLIIWQIPVPTQQKNNRGNTDWPELYKVNPNNILYSHDAHLMARYPYIYEVKENITGLACVNVSSFFASQIGGIRKALTFSSHDISKLKHRFDYDKRQNGFLSLQTFKGWKHVEDLVRAIPHMEKETRKVMAGAGREYAYMISKDKCKPEYFLDKKYDPDLKDLKFKQDTRIWDYAGEHGMEYFGWITPSARNIFLKRVKCLIDPSWNLNFAKHGGHFNRVFIDAIKNGAIPIGRNFGITSNKEGNGYVFKANENYIMIPHDATPKEFAEIVERTNRLPRKEWKRILKNNYELIKLFDRKVVAQHFIDLSKGKPAGFFKDKHAFLKQTPHAVKLNSAKLAKSFFGLTPKKFETGLKKFI